MVLESNTLDVLFVKDGQQGEDGKVLDTWIKYAKAANGTGMTMILMGRFILVFLTIMKAP